MTSIHLTKGAALNFSFEIDLHGKVSRHAGRQRSAPELTGLLQIQKMKNLNGLKFMSNLKS